MGEYDGKGRIMSIYEQWRSNAGESVEGVEGVEDEEEHRGESRGATP
jgi:hypothetical protein